MRARTLGRRVVQIAAVIALGVGVTLGTTAVLADDAATQTETPAPAPQVVYEWPERDAPAAEPGTAPQDSEAAGARSAGVEWD